MQDKSTQLLQPSNQTLQPAGGPWRSGDAVGTSGRAIDVIFSDGVRTVQR